MMQSAQSTNYRRVDVNVGRRLQIDSFLDSPCDRWTLENASDEGSAIEERSLVQLLDRLLPQEWTGLHEDFRVHRFLNGVRQAFRNNKMLIVDWWLTKYLPINATTVGTIMKSAIDYGRIHVLELLEQQGALPVPNGQERVECRHADVAFWLYERGYSLSIDVCAEIHRNNLEFLQWTSQHQDIHVLGQRNGTTAMASVNSIEMAQWLQEKYPDTYWKTPIDTDGVDLEMIKWMDENIAWDMHPEWNDIGSRLEEAHENWVNSSFRAAAKNGQLEIVQYLGDHRLRRWRDESIIFAAMHGHIEIVKWIHEQDPTLSRVAISFAAIGGHFEIVQWLHDKSEASEHEPINCSSRGYFRIAQIAFKLNAMDAAALNGSFDIVRWLHANRNEGCTAEALNGAVRTGNLELVQWLIEHRPECANSISTDLMDLAAKHGHLEIVMWLHDNRSEGCTTNAVDQAAKGGHFEVVKFLIENVSRNSCITTSVLDNAAAGGHYRLLCWLYNNSSQGCTSDGVDRAAVVGNMQIVKFLYEHCDLRVTASLIIDIYEQREFTMAAWLMENDPKCANVYQRFKLPLSELRLE